MTDQQADHAVTRPDLSSLGEAPPQRPLPDSIGLPPIGTTRWVIRRKAAVVAGVHNGLISLEEACRYYNLSIEEFLSWQRQIEQHGLLGLRTTRLQDYRRGSEAGEDGPDLKP
jgi:hypothetical protein